MSLASLELDDTGTSVTFDDERDRAGKDVRADAFASITLDDRATESWGVFLTREQALAALGWLTALCAGETP